MAQHTFRNGPLDSGKYTSKIQDGGDTYKGTGNTPEDARSDAHAKAVRDKKS